jgi:hypothetical protein
MDVLNQLNFEPSVLLNRPDNARDGFEAHGKSGGESPLTRYESVLII